MTGIGLIKIDKLTDCFKDIFLDNLFAIVSVGSLAVGDFKNNWSDVDLLVIVKKLDLEVKLKVANLKKMLDAEYKIPFGINVITEQEFTNPHLSVISLDGKTLQAMLELKFFPNRLLYSCGVSMDEIFSPNREETKAYSLSNFFMLLLRNRKTLSSHRLSSTEEYKKALEREIRASFIMTKLAVQYFISLEHFEHQYILIQAKSIFKDFNFDVIDKVSALINSWKDLDSINEMKNIFESIDFYIENFGSYITKLISKDHK